MSDMSDSENVNLSKSADVTGSTASTSSTRSSSAGEATGPSGQMPDNLSGISDIPSPSDPVTPISREQTGAARLEEILRVGPSTAPERGFTEELGGAAQAPLAPVVDLTAEGGDAAERTASQASTSGRGDDTASDSSDPSGEDIHDHQRPRSRGTRVNDMKVYRRADAEMVGLAGDRPVYSADYYTSAVKLRYLAALRREFSIPNDVDLVVPGANDLPSRPPSGHIALSAEVSKGHSSRGVRTRTSSSSTCGFTQVVVGCTNSYFELPPSERIPVAFRKGYVWTRAPHTPARTLAKIDELRELSDLERSQHRLLAEGSLKQHWVGSSLTSDRPKDQPRASPSRVTIARMPEPAVHYRSRTGRPVVETTDDQSRVPRGVPEATVHGSSSGDASPGTWGPRVADEDLDLVIRELFPAQGLRIEEPMADRELRGIKRSSTEERIARLHKMARMGKGKGKEGASTTSRPASCPEARPDRPRDGRPAGRHEARSGRSREDRPEVPPPASRSGRGEPRPRDAAPLPSGPSSPESFIHRVLVSKFADQLSAEVAESSRRSDHIAAISDSTAQLIETVCILFSGSAAARAHSNRMADEAKKEVEDRAKAAEEAARSVEEKLRRAEEWAKKAEQKSEEAETLWLELDVALKKVEQELEAARAEQKRYLEVALPAALNDARAQAVQQYLQSEDFRARLVTEYKDGMRDMKAGFIATPSLVGVDWSFVPEESEETAAEGALEEGEASGAAPVPENVVVLDDPEQPVATEQPAVDQPTSPALDVSISDLFPH
ncbi:hypothetical protein TIFTF001_030284 [Ficus carica]|uniref:Uncharacterized protein n=1 Tax=Ficus carica TaxID=3494 RepID=A0AA88DTX6_FICCA|nr:hypothetical protein TIFTF001_030284 [Ficus carica]